MPNAAEKALVNVEFEEEGTEWCVLMVKFDDDADELVVYYQDFDSQFSREELECDLMHDDVERSSVKEVVKWIKDSPKQAMKVERGGVEVRAGGASRELEELKSDP